MHKHHRGASAHQNGVSCEQHLRSWDDALPVPRLKLAHAAFLVFALAVLCFANSWDGDFVFDDTEAIINNKDLSPETRLLDIFYHDFWGANIASNNSHKSYRPLTVLTFRWNYFLSGGLQPQGFRLVNIFLHGLISSLFLLVFSVILCGRLRSDAGEIVFGSRKASLLSALLFACHPIHTESVAGIVGRADLLCALMFLSSFLCYVHACQKGGSYLRPTTFNKTSLFVSMLLCAVSVLFKEQGITGLGICSAFDVLIQCQLDPLSLIGSSLSPAPSPQTTPTHKPQGSPSKGRLSNQGSPAKGRLSNQGSPSKRAPPMVNKIQAKEGDWVHSLISRQLCLVLTGVVILISRWRIMGSSPPTFRWVDNPHSFQNGTITRGLNYNYLYSLNLWLLLNPWWLCFDWSMGCVPVIESLLDLRNLATVAMWSLLFYFLFLCFKCFHTREARRLLMCLALLIIPFLPATNLLFRVGFVVAERILYLPSAAICCMVVIGASRLARHYQYRSIVQVFVISLLVIFTLRSFQRSEEWKKELSLFEAGAKVCPQNAKVHYNIGKIHGDLGNDSIAINKYRLAISLYPEYDQAMNNLANILKERKENVEAEELLLKAVEIRSDFAAAWMNLGIVQSDLGKRALAEVSYRTALLHRRKYADCHYNLGNLYLDMERHSEALQEWLKATEEKVTHSSAWNNIIILLDNLGRVDELLDAGAKATSYLPDEASIFYNIGNALGKAGKYEQSETYLLKATKLDPRNANYFSNLGVLYHRWNKYDLAEKAYKKALQLDRTLKSTEENLQMLLRKMQKERQSDT